MLTGCQRLVKMLTATGYLRLSTYALLAHNNTEPILCLLSICQGIISYMVSVYWHFLQHGVHCYTLTHDTTFVRMPCFCRCYLTSDFRSSVVSLFACLSFFLHGTGITSQLPAWRTRPTRATLRATFSSVRFLSSTCFSFV
jgi:hypothetical protein